MKASPMWCLHRADTQRVSNEREEKEGEEREEGEEEGTGIERKTKRQAQANERTPLCHSMSQPPLRSFLFQLLRGSSERDTK